MKMNLFVKAVIISVLAFSLAYIFSLYSPEIFQMKKTEFWVLTGKQNYQTFDEKVSFQNIDSVQVLVNVGDIVVEPSKQAEGKVSVTTGTDPSQTFHARKEQHKLIIEFSDLTRPYNNSTLTLKIPATVKTIDIKNVSGEVKLSNLSLNSVKVSNTRGDIQLNHMQVMDAHLQSTSGAIYCDADVKKLLLKTVFGDVEVKTSELTPEYQIETVSGDISITAPRDLNATLEIQSVNGSVSPIHSSDNHKSSQNQGFIHAKSVNGDIRIQH